MTTRSKQRVHYSIEIGEITDRGKAKIARNLRLNYDFKIVAYGVQKGIPTVTIKDAHGDTCVVGVGVTTKAKRGRGIVSRKVHCRIAENDIAKGKVIRATRGTRSGGPKGRE